MTQIFPCNEHHGIVAASFPWERALDVALACKHCEVTK